MKKREVTVDVGADLEKTARKAEVAVTYCAICKKNKTKRKQKREKENVAKKGKKERQKGVTIITSASCQARLVHSSRSRCFFFIKFAQPKRKNTVSRKEKTINKEDITTTTTLTRKKGFLQKVSKKSNVKNQQQQLHQQNKTKSQNIERIIESFRFWWQKCWKS